MSLKIGQIMMNPKHHEQLSYDKLLLVTTDQHVLFTGLKRDEKKEGTYQYIPFSQGFCLWHFWLLVDLFQRRQYLKDRWNIHTFTITSPQEKLRHHSINIS